MHNQVQAVDLVQVPEFAFVVCVLFSKSYNGNQKVAKENQTGGNGCKNTRILDKDEITMLFSIISPLSKENNRKFYGTES